MFRCWLLVFLLIGYTVRAADSFMGFSAGLSFAFGNKVNRIGLSASGYYTYGFAQLNADLKVYYNLQSLGLKRKTPELQFAMGAGFGYGSKDSLRNRFIGLAESNMLFRNSVGYSCVLYHDRNLTSQSTGIIDLRFDKLRIVTENDLLAGGQGWRDRFRTGALLIEYQYLDTRFALNATLWTGDFTGCDNVYDSDYPARFGYRTCEKGQYCDYSLGLLSLQVKQLLPLPLCQVAQLNLGVDSEHVRNVLQNKIIHDQPFLPESWIWRKPAHLPMVTPDGNIYLYGADERLKPATFYYNFAFNTGTFY